jgi:hypothetical protein
MSQSTSTLPAETDGTEFAQFNALRHGVLSRYTALPWENADEYNAFAAALASEHDPQGPTEEHLVEELAGILWRKRRLRLAEAAAHRRGLWRSRGSHQDTVHVALVHVDVKARSVWIEDAIHATAADTTAEICDMQDDEAMTHRALDLLHSGRKDAYEAALTALREDTREWWAETLACEPDELEGGQEFATTDSVGLRRFLEAEVLPWLDTRKK